MQLPEVKYTNRNERKILYDTVHASLKHWLPR